MLRKTLALLLRALRVDARSVRPHLMRFSLVALVLYLLVFSGGMSTLINAPGLMLFQSMAMTNIWFIALVGVPYFSSAIAEEKEERTLGLLKMADISGLSLMLGKWLPRVIGMLSLLAVQFPFTMLAITLGGITTHQVIAAYAALLVYLLYVGAVSLLASVVCQTTAAACRLAFIIIIARALLPHLMQLAARAWSLTWAEFGPIGQLGKFLSTASVTAHLTRALDVAFLEAAWPFSLSWMMIESGALFAAAWLVFEPCTRVEVSDAKPGVWQRVAMKRTGPRRRAWQAALVGKDYRLLGGGPLWTTVRFFLYLFAVFVMAVISDIGGRRPNLEAVGYIAMTTGLAMLALELIIAAARVFRSELNDLTWSSLVILPRSLPQVAWSKIAGSLLGCWPPLVTFGVGCLFVPDALPEFLSAVFSEADAFLVSLYVMLQLVLVLECTMLCSIALGWAGWPLAAPIAAFTVVFANLVFFTAIFASRLNAGAGASEVLFGMLDLVSGAIVIGLAMLIARRLTVKAAEGA